MSGREAFENVVGEVAKTVQAEITASLEEAYKDALETIETEEKETLLKAAEIPHSKERQINTLRRRIIGSAELGARNRSLQTLEETVNRVFEESLKKLEDPSSIKGYETAFRRFLEEGIDAIGGDEFVARTRSEDRALLKKVSRAVEKARGVKIKPSSEGLDRRGGVQVMSSDGSVIYDNTIDARMERLRPLLRKQISELLLRE